MIPDRGSNELVNLNRHFQYANEKEKFLNSLSADDLLFIRDIICSPEVPVPNKESTTKAKRIDQALTDFETNTHSLTKKVKEYLSSWVWSKPKLEDETKKQEIVKFICNKFEGEHLPFEVANLHLSTEPEIGLFEILYKRPDDSTQLKAWEREQDNYWKQIAEKIGLSLPKILPKYKTWEEEKRHRISTYVKEYLTGYRQFILDLEKEQNFWSRVNIPSEIKEILSQKPTIENILKVYQWK